MRWTNGSCRWARPWFLSAIGASLTPSAHAGVGFWTSGGPYDVDVRAPGRPHYVAALTIDPTAPATLYAGTFYGGAFKSTDSGASWTEASTGLPIGGAVYVLAINPTTPTILYAGGYEGIFKSTDSGANWASASTGLPARRPIGALAINPTTPTTLYASVSTGDGVFKSTDAAATWTHVGLVGLFVHELVIDPMTSTTVYAAAGRDGVFKSADAGASWAAARTGLAGKWIYTLAIDPKAPATLYAGGEWGVFKSTDSGGTWAAAGLTNRNVRSLVIDPATPTTLYAGTVNGVYKSTDSGATWAAAGLEELVAEHLALDRSGATTLYAGTSSGVWQFTPGRPYDFFPVTPCRLIDTRNPAGPLAGPALQAGATRAFMPAGACGIPATATALSVNATAASPVGPGHLRLFPRGARLPTVSTINYSEGQTRATNAIVVLGDAGALSVYVGQIAGTVDFILDVNGYYE